MCENVTSDLQGFKETTGYATDGALQCDNAGEKCPLAAYKAVQWALELSPCFPGDTNVVNGTMIPSAEGGVFKGNTATQVDVALISSNFSDLKRTEFARGFRVQYEG